MKYIQIDEYLHFSSLLPFFPLSCSGVQSKLKEDEDKALKQKEEEQRRRQQQNRIELERWKETEAQSQAQLNQAAQEALKNARRASSVDPGTLTYELILCQYSIFQISDTILRIVFYIRSGASTSPRTGSRRSQTAAPKERSMATKESPAYGSY
jgi:hypothetical protein